MILTVEQIICDHVLLFLNSKLMMRRIKNFGDLYQFLESTTLGPCGNCHAKLD